MSPEGTTPSDEDMRKLSVPNPTQEQVVEAFLISGYLPPNQTLKILKELDSYDDKNYLVQTSDGTHYLAKIYNGVESQDFIENGTDSSIYFQSAMMEHLNLHDIPTSAPVLSKTGEPSNVASLPVVSVQHSPHNLVVRLLTWVPGRTMSSLPFLPIESLLDAGRFLGKLDEKLDLMDPQTFRACKRFHAWDGKNTLDLRKYTHCIDDERRRGMVESVFDAFQHDIIESNVEFRTGILQSDFNDANILVDKDMKVSGVIDFGDSVCRYVI
jgi:Ser/Thr protein kinase RdoA (MazF antagonist)